MIVKTILYCISASLSRCPHVGFQLVVLFISIFQVSTSKSPKWKPKSNILKYADLEFKKKEWWEKQQQVLIKWAFSSVSNAQYCPQCDKLSKLAEPLYDIEINSKGSLLPDEQKQKRKKKYLFWWKLRNAVLFSKPSILLRSK